jgi:hypothetical protein
MTKRKYRYKRVGGEPDESKHLVGCPGCGQR